MTTEIEYMETLTVTHIGQSKMIKYHPLLDIIQWLDCFIHLILREKIEDDEIIPTLLKCLEPEVLIKIQENVAPTDILDFSYDNISALLKIFYLSSDKMTTAEKCFMYRFQYPQESIPQYVLGLRKLSSKCNPALRLQDNLKDIFILGLKNKETKKILEKHPNISFSTAVCFAHHMELSEITNFKKYYFVNINDETT